MPSMKKIPEIKDKKTVLKTFLAQVNIDIVELNLLIDKYNEMSDEAEQIEMLQQIYLRKQQMEYKFSDVHKSRCPSYCEEIHVNLFNELQKQFASLGIHSLHNVTKLDPMAKTVVTNSPDNINEIIANMSPDKASEMLEILENGQEFDREELNNLYKEDEPGFVEYQSFLRKNEITFLGGSNSYNFKITPNDGSPSVVLKVDNRLGMPKSAEADLREHSLKDVLTSVKAERLVTASMDEENFITRTLLVTEFCRGGDVESHSRTHGDNANARIESALSIYSKMGAILTEISLDGYAFPDMKNSNWLVDENGTLRVADSKTFVFSEETGVIDRVKNKEKWFGMHTSKFMDPPEILLKKDIFSADKMHSYMLGKNLYEYLAGNELNLTFKHNGADYDFSAPIFQIPEGKELKNLIINLIKPNPDDRISLNDALVQLKKMKVQWESPLASHHHSSKSVEVVPDKKKEVGEKFSGHTVAFKFKLLEIKNQNIEEQVEKANEAPILK